MAIRHARQEVPHARIVGPHQLTRNEYDALCRQPGCQIQHPYHTARGTILRSIRPLQGGLLSDEMETGQNLTNPLVMPRSGEHIYYYD